MPIRVPGARGCNGDPGSDRIDERLGGGGPAAVMGNLEQIDRVETAREQLRVDLLLDVAHQQEPPAPHLPGEHHRDVVDARAAVGRFEWDAAARRPQHLELDLVDGEAVSSRDRHPNRAVGVGHLVQPCGIPGAGTAHAWLHHAIDVISLEQEGQPGHVILVRVRQDHRVDPPVPGRNASIERDEEPIGIRATVDQQAPTARAFDQDRVALANIEDRHACGATWTGRDHAACHHDRNHEPDRCGTARRPAVLAFVGTRRPGGLRPRQYGWRGGIGMVRASSTTPPRERGETRHGCDRGHRVKGRLEGETGERQPGRDLHDRDKDPEDDPPRCGQDGTDRGRGACLDRDARGERNQTDGHRRGDQRDDGEVDQR